MPQPPAPSAAVEKKAGQPQASELRHLPSLDGWRAVSIILVLGCHCSQLPGFPSTLTHVFWWFDGDLGVRCFFAISGFLITWLLGNEVDRHGKVSLRHFYIRRALRILPVYFAYMAVLWLLHLITPFNQTRTAWLANLTFTTNFFQTSWPSGHLWSLSVEEQFYLLWPFLFVAFGLAGNFKAGLKILAVPVLLAPVWRVISYKSFYPASLAALFAHFSFFNYFDCLATGCLCALLVRSRSLEVRSLLSRWSKGTAVCAVAMILSPYIMGALPIPGRVIVASTASVQAFGFALLMLQSIFFPDLGFYRVLNTKPMRHLGVLSYSIYIWQMLFCTKPETFVLGDVWWMSFPGWIVPVLIVAHLSYYILERPFFRLRSRFR